MDEVTFYSGYFCDRNSILQVRTVLFTPSPASSKLKVLPLAKMSEMSMCSVLIDLLTGSFQTGKGWLPAVQLLQCISLSA